MTEKGWWPPRGFWSGLLQLAGALTIGVDGLAAYIWFAAGVPISEGFTREPTSVQSYVISGVVFAAVFSLAVAIIIFGCRLERPRAAGRG